MKQNDKSSDEQTVFSQKAPLPVGPYPHARRVGPFLYLSGIGPRQKGSQEIPGVTLDSSGKIQSHDIVLQCDSVFQNVETVLEEAGAKLSDLVDITVFLTHMEKDFATFNEKYKTFFQGISAARTTVEVKSLPTPIAIELKCVAFIGDEK